MMRNKYKSNQIDTESPPFFLRKKGKPCLQEENNH